MAGKSMVYILWDAENLRWQDSYTIISLLKPVYRELYKHIDPCSIFRKTAVLPNASGDLKNVFINCGFHVSDPGKKIEASDRIIESIVTQIFEDSDPDNTTIVLMSSDKDFSEIMRNAKRRGFYTIVVHSADITQGERSSHAAIIKDYCHVDINIRRICNPCDRCYCLYHSMEECSRSNRYCFHCNTRFSDAISLRTHIPETLRIYWKRYITTVYCTICLHRECVCRNVLSTKLCPICGLEVNINDTHFHTKSFYELDEDPISICHQCYQYSHIRECKSRDTKHICVICEMVCDNFEHLMRHMIRRHIGTR